MNGEAHLPQSVVEDMCHRVIGCNAIPPLAVNGGLHLVTHLEHTLYLAHMEHVACSHLHPKDKPAFMGHISDGIHGLRSMLIEVWPCPLLHIPS
jgi:hypothetical protein